MASWLTGVLIIALGLWWARRFLNREDRNATRHSDSLHLSPLSLPPTPLRSGSPSSGKQAASGRSYAYLFDARTKAFTPISRDEIEARLSDIRANLPKWRRLEQRAAKSAQDWKPDPKLRNEIQKELPIIERSAGTVEKFLDDLSFENDRSQEKYYNFWDEIVGIQTDLEMYLKDLIEAEANPEEE